MTTLIIHWDLRREYCDTYELFGDFCSCSNPETFVADRNLNANSQINNAVVVMLAYRVPSLHRSLQFLTRARGFDRSRIETYTMARHPQLARFLELVDLPLTTTNQTHAMLSTAIARHLIFALAHALHTHPDAQFVIVLEEDVQVSPDFFVFLNKTAPLLLEDPSLYCVSAHNDLSYPQTSYDPRAVLRTESYPNYGWMVSLDVAVKYSLIETPYSFVSQVKRSFAEEMVSSLSAIDEEYDWDVVTYHYLRRGRECIIPEVSRSFHFAHEGSHISQLSVRRYFSNKNLNKDPEALVEGVDLLHQDKYEATLVSMLERAKFLRLPEETPCQRDFFRKISVRENDVLVLFFQLDGDIKVFRNNDVWATLAHCLNIFGIESREGHQGLYRLRYGPAHFLLVAHPASPYRLAIVFTKIYITSFPYKFHGRTKPHVRFPNSHYKPEEVGVFSASPEEVLFARNATTIHEEPNPMPCDMDHFLDTDIPSNRNKT
nr:protein O-linked-mannose beta-1,2-N-acetylglucosaminyltransferase 1-like [Penaeus vannamei]